VTIDSPPPGDQQNLAYQQVTRSSRSMTPTRRFLYGLAFPFAMGLVRFLWFSYRVKRIIGDEHMDAAIRASGPVIPALWHQHLLLGVWYLLRKRKMGLRLGFLISPSVDGEVGAMVAKRLDGYVIRGSTTYTGARALRDFYLAVAKEKVSPLVTPDGPKGPRYVAKSGAIMIAQLAGKPIVPISFAADRVFKLRAWDRFILPLPFARIVLAVGEPMKVPKVMTPEELEAMQRKLQHILKELFETAQRELH
jgi:lysophospholipid acyltransferase (LPLAT)-like uncharacterized protein